MERRKKIDNYKKYTSIRFLLTLLVLILISGTMFCAVSMPHSVKTESAANGVLDLRGEDFSKTRFILAGDWEFYFGELVAPGEFIHSEPLGKAYIPLPNGWKAQGYPVRGCATYRLRLLTDESELMIFVPEIMTSSVIYINGEKVFEAGTVGKTADEFEMRLRNAFVHFSLPNGEAEIVVWASNYYWRQGGLTKPVEIGLAENVMNDALPRRTLLAAFIGAVLMIGIYHFNLFLHRKSDRVYLIFALFCLTTAARFFLEINALGALFLPGGVGAVLHRIYMASMVIQAALVLIFTHTVFGLTYKGRQRQRGKLQIAPLIGAAVLTLAAAVIVIQDKLSIGYSVLCLAAACILFGLSYGGNARRVFYWMPISAAIVHAMFIPYTVVEGQWIGISILPLAMTIIFAAKEKTVYRNPYNILYFLSMIVFILWEPLTKIILLDHNFAASVASNLFFILCQSVMLAVGYAESKRQAEELADKTDFYHHMSHDILTPLTRVSTCVQSANEYPEDAKELLTKAQDDIMQIAEMINEALRQGKEGGEQK